LRSDSQQPLHVGDIAAQMIFRAGERRGACIRVPLCADAVAVRVDRGETAPAVVAAIAHGLSSAWFVGGTALFAICGGAILGHRYVQGDLPLLEGQ
jgi:hypothetical protein